MQVYVVIWDLGTKSLCPRFIYNKTVDFMTLNGRLQRTRVRSRSINRIFITDKAVKSHLKRRTYTCLCAQYIEA